MHLDWSTLALQTINFAILVWLLHRFLYKPVLRVIDLRRGEIDKHFAEVRTAEARVEEQRAAIDAQRAGFATERNAVLKAAAEQAESAAAERRAQAEREASNLLDQSRKTLAQEREAALAEARLAAVELGAKAAGRLLAEIPLKLRAEAWLEQIENYLAALPSGERQALLGQGADDAPLKVVTASPLPHESGEAWQLRLGAILGAPINAEFAVDPRLVAGAELHFPTAILRFSWQSALASMRAEVEGDDNARR